MRQDLFLFLFIAVCISLISILPGNTPTGYQIATSDNSMVERSFVYTAVGPGEEFLVYIDIYIHEGYEHYSYEIVENVPAGWEIIDTGGAVRNGQQLAWSYSGTDPVEPTGFVYTVKAPSIGPGIFVGTFEFDGSGQDNIYGDTQIAVGNCINNEARSCTTVNGCNGEQTCVSSYWGVCVATESYCDTDCDGMQECTDSSCAICECEGAETRQCTTANGCSGLQYCSSGSYGPCISTQNYCDMDCDGSQECTSGACPSCTCSQEETLNCITSNGCAGKRYCVEGVFGPCAPTQNFCDIDCDGTQECTTEQCAVCSCTAGQNRSCLTPDNCQGIQECNYGEFGQCTGIQYYCDHNCDGTPECGNEPCSDCGCIENWVCSSYSDCINDIKTRTCSDQNDCGTTANMPELSLTCGESSSGGGGGGGGAPSGTAPSATCTEEWLCGSWGPCTPDGLMYRSCTDQNGCGTTDNKPLDLETCTYKGTCTDNMMNNGEDGIDCGGSCAKCGSLEVAPVLDIYADSIEADILTDYELGVTIKNTGTGKAENIMVGLDKWSDELLGPLSISAGKEKKIAFELMIPGSAAATSLGVQAYYSGIPVASYTVPVSIKVPQYAISLLKSGTAYHAHIVIDNRERQARTINIKITGGGPGSFSEEYSVAVPPGQIFQQTMPQDIILRPGTYTIASTFSEGDKIVGSQTFEFTVDGLPMRWIYIGAGALVVIVVGVILLKRKSPFPGSPQ